MQPWQQAQQAQQAAQQAQQAAQQAAARSQQAAQQAAMQASQQASLRAQEAAQRAALRARQSGARSAGGLSSAQASIERSRRQARWATGGGYQPVRRSAGSRIFGLIAIVVALVVVGVGIYVVSHIIAGK